MCHLRDNLCLQDRDKTPKYGNRMVYSPTFSLMVFGEGHLALFGRNGTLGCTAFSNATS